MARTIRISRKSILPLVALAAAAIVALILAGGLLDTLPRRERLLVVIAGSALAFLAGTARAEPAPRWAFWSLIGVLVTAQARLIFEPGVLDALFLLDDHGKYFGYTTDNTSMLLRYGAPYGFNHHFQGGIPALYLRSTFLEQLPFQLLLGEQRGYQASVVAAVVAIPFAGFAAVRWLGGPERAARTMAFLCAFGVGVFPELRYGMIPALMSLSIGMLAIAAAVRWVRGEPRWLFPAALLWGLLLYTHVVMVLAATVVLVLILAGVIASRRRRLPPLARLAALAALAAWIGSPFLVTAWRLRSFFRTDWVEIAERTWGQVASWTWMELSTPSPIWIATAGLLVLAVWHRLRAPADPRRRTVQGAALLALALIPLAAMEHWPSVGFLSQKLKWMALPLLTAAAAALVAAWPRSPFSRVPLAAAALALVVFAGNHHQGYLQLQPNFWQRDPLVTVAGLTEIDPGLSGVVAPGEHVAVENIAHLILHTPLEVELPTDIGHWLPYLQHATGARLFAHMGNDAHPYNRARHLYLTNGTHRGQPLDPAHGDELVALLHDWGVGKVCVWSARSRWFLERRPEYERSGQTDHYVCYDAQRAPRAEVWVAGGGRGALADPTPFSFAVDLEGVEAGDEVRVARNLVPLWSARDAHGRAVPLRPAEDGQIAFDAPGDGRVAFRYARLPALHAAAAAVILMCLLGWIGIRVHARP